MKKTLMSARSVGKIMTVSLLAGGFLLAGSTSSWADRGRSEGRNEGRSEQRYENRQGKKSDHRHHPGTVVREVPRGSRSVVVGTTRYYVHDHRFYASRPGGYVLVRPPLGAVVATLPAGSISITIGGVFYSRFDDVYYRPAPRGYVVVAPPVSAPFAVHTHGSVIVWTPTLNVRTGPGMHFPVSCQVVQGQMLIVSAHASGWHYVQLPTGAFGWVMSDYTRSLGAG
jgi:hypothetical protein